MIDLHGRHFSPVSNSKGGRVQSDSIFIFSQKGGNFTATYSGVYVTDGHIIGRMTGPKTADILYHSRANSGELEAGQAVVSFDFSNDKIIMNMNWQWLNGSKASGKSSYGEI